MVKKKQHGGQREGAGPPRKLVEPERVTLTVEKSHLKQLKAKYGREWQDAVRSLIEAHLHGIQQLIVAELLILAYGNGCKQQTNVRLRALAQPAIG